MDKISKAIKCANCKEILVSPMFLPCEHNICGSHLSRFEVDEIRYQYHNRIECGECAQVHQVPEDCQFPFNKSLAEIIETKINMLDFGHLEHHKNTNDSCKRLDQLLREIDVLLNDPNKVTNETIDNLRIRINLKSENLKLYIKEETTKVLNKLKDYEQRCKSFLYSKDYESISNQLNENKKTTGSELKNWFDELNQIKFDEQRWKDLKEECEKKIVEANEQVKQFKNQLHLNDGEIQTNLIDQFDKININSAFDLI